MILSAKCQYALRAVYEIARSSGGGVLTIEDIAAAQHIPRRYLEGILNQLRKGQLLEAQRGRCGGYRLARRLKEIRVGDIVRLIDGPIRAVPCVGGKRTSNCPMQENCVFLPTWKKLQEAIDSTLDSTNYHDLIEMEKEAKAERCLNYAI